ncbi:MAG: hypothetical protein ACREUQ_00795 [Burkholderiales bacterium]
MSKLTHIAIGALAAGLTQFSVLVASGVSQVLPLVAGCAGAIGAGIVLHMRQLPRRSWPESKRSTFKRKKRL